MRLALLYHIKLFDTSIDNFLAMVVNLALMDLGCLGAVSVIW